MSGVRECFCGRGEEDKKMEEEREAEGKAEEVEKISGSEGK